MSTYPTSQRPGMGLPAYKLTEHIPFETLWLAPRLTDNDTLAALPDNVRLLSVEFPFVTSGDHGQIGLAAHGRRLSAVAAFNVHALYQSLRYRPVLVHTHSPMYLPAALSMKCLVGAPVCLTFHGTDYVRVEERKWLQALVGQADRVFYVSPHMACGLRRYIPEERLVHISNGVDRSMFCPDGGPKEPQLVAVGTLRWHKGFDTLIRAFGLVREQEPSWRLVIVGDGELRQELTQLSGRLGLDDCLTFTGSVSQPQLVTILNRSSVFVLSSVTEGLPKVVLEAMACGLPVVTTDVGACADTVANAGIVVPPRDPQALTAAILRLIRDEHLRLNLCTTALERAREYSWETYATRTNAVYDSLLAASCNGAGLSD